MGCDSRSPLQKPKAEMLPSLLNVEQIAEILGCSTRHVRRLTDMGKFPSPVRLNSLVRWPRAEIEQWIADGCPRIRTVRTGGAA